MNGERKGSPDIPGFTHERDSFDVWGALGLLGLSFTGFLTAITLQSASIPIRVSLVAFAVTIPYWGSLVVMFEFQRYHGLRIVPEVFGGCIGAVFILLTLLGIASLFFFAWIPAGMVFLAACAGSWFASWKYIVGRRKIGVQQDA